MQAHNIFAHIKDSLVLNVFICETYSKAERIGRMLYGTNAITLEVNQYPVSQGYKYINNEFYDLNGNLVYKLPTEKEKIEQTLGLVNNINKQINIVKPNVNCSLEEYKQYKLKILSKACNDTIHKGVDITTSNGNEHFSLMETDQINIQALIKKIEQGASQVPYHSDDNRCRLFSAEEIVSLANAAEQLKIYNTTRYNYLKVWVNRCTTKEELNEIQYFSTLPEDLRDEFTVLISAIGQ